MSKTAIAVIGAGNVGGTLGRRWARAGHIVRFGVRDPGRTDLRHLLVQAGNGASAHPPAEAVTGADIVVLTTPWNAVASLLESLPPLDGTIVVDCTNPIGPGFRLAHGTTTSGAEQIAAQAPGARIVKAFNTTGFETMADPAYPGGPLSMILCGDDRAACATVAALAADLGFDPVVSGPLHHARYLEPLAMLWIEMAIREGKGRDFGFRLITR